MSPRFEFQFSRSFYGICLFLSGLFCGVFLPSLLHRGVEPLALAQEQRSPSRAATPASPSEDGYKQTLLFTRVLEQVRQDYVDPARVSYHELIQASLKGMLSSLDPHSQFLDEEAFREMQRETRGEFTGLGFVVEPKDGYIMITGLLEGTPSFRAGLLPGDLIVRINGKSTQRMPRASAIRLLRGQRGEKVDLVILRPTEKESGRTTEQVFEVQLTRETIKVTTVKEAKVLPPELSADHRVGYVRVEQFGENTMSEFDRALSTLENSKLDALVLDLRNNPGGLLDSAVEMAGRFLPEGQLIVATQGRTAETRREYRAKVAARAGNYPVVVLINGFSASGAEIVAGALQDTRRALIVGETSFGKGSVQSVLDLSNGVGLRLTTAKYYTPSERVIHEVGVVPNIRVAVSEREERLLIQQRSPQLLSAEERKALKDVRDTTLDRAVTLLRGVLIYGERHQEARAASS